MPDAGLQSPGRRELTVLAIAALLLSLLYTFPLWTHPFTYLAGPGDPYEHLSITWWTSRKLLSGHWGGMWSIPPYFYPERLPLASGDPQFGTTLLGLPVFVLTGSAVGAYNFVLLLSFPLTAIGGYLLARHVTGSRTAATAAALLWAFGLWHRPQSEHQQILSVEGFAFALLALHRFAETGRRRWLALLFGSWLAQEFLAEYWGAFQLLLIAPAGLLLLAAVYRLESRRLLAAIATVGAATLPWLACQWPLFAQGRQHPVEIVQMYSANLADYLPQRDTILWGSLGHLHRLPDGTPSHEHVVSPGLLALLLAAWAAIRFLRVVVKRGGDEPGLRVRLVGENPLLWPYFALAVVAVIWSCGFSVDLFDVHLLHGIHGLFTRLPGGKGLRVLVRMGIIADLGIAVLAGAGLADMLRRFSQSKSARTAALLCACAVIAAENFPRTGTRLNHSGPYVPEIQAVDRWLASQPAGPALFLPLGDDPIAEGARMWRQTVFGKPMVNGVETFFPDTYVSDMRLFQHPAAAAAASRARALGLKYIVVERPGPYVNTPASIGPLQPVPQSLPPPFHRMYEDAGATVYGLD